jgi:hypothetical protein
MYFLIKLNIKSNGKIIDSSNHISISALVPTVILSTEMVGFFDHKLVFTKQDKRGLTTRYRIYDLNRSNQIT